MQKIPLFSAPHFARIFLVALLLGVASGAIAGEQSYPPGVGFLNVKDAPYGAKGDGVTDDSTAIQRAIWDARAMTGVYLPKGTYRVSRQIKWQNVNRKNGKPSRTGHIWLHGQSREETIVRLDDGAKGFGQGQLSPFVEDGDRSRAVFYTETEGAPPDAAIENYISNLTIDTGKNNPGAVGIAFLGNNTAAIREVTIRSGDGSGRVGLQMTRIPGPCLVEDVAVEGFQYGVATSGAAGLLNVVMEGLRLSNQTRAGVINRAIVVTINDLISRNSVPALQNIVPPAAPPKEGDPPPPPPKPVGLVQILNSKLLGGKGGAAIENEAFVFARNIETGGYDRALQERGKAVEGQRIAEFATGGAVSIFDSPQTSLNLPVAPAPPVFRTNDFTQWANVLDYASKTPETTEGAATGEGAADVDEKTDGDEAGEDAPAAPEKAGQETGNLLPPAPKPPGPRGVDMADAIQKAMNSGKPVVVFPKGKYFTSRTITIPPTVKTIVCLRSVIGATDGPSRTFSVRNGRVPVFRVVGETDEPLTIEWLTFGGSPGPARRNGSIGLEHISRRPVVIRHGNFRGYSSKPGAGPLFVNDVVGGEWVVGPNQNAYFRQLNPEGSRLPQRVLNNGGKCVILGIKMEGDKPVVRTINGGQTELWGGFLRPSAGYPLGDPAYIVENAAMSASWGGMAHADYAAYLILVRETRGGQTREWRRRDAKAANLTARGEAQVTLFNAYPATRPVTPTNASFPPELLHRVEEVPAPWQLLEINDTTQTGELSVAGPSVMLSGAGKPTTPFPKMEAAIGTGPQDALTMAAAPLPGEGGLSAQFVSLRAQGISGLGKVGLMIRASEEPGAPMVFVGQHTFKRGRGSKEQKALVVYARAKAGEEAKSLAEVPLPTLPWLRLTRRAGLVQAQTSTDGQNWTNLGQATPLAGAALVGFGAASEFHYASVIGEWSGSRLEGVPGAPGPNEGRFAGGWSGGEIGNGILLPHKIEAVGAGGEAFRITGSGWFMRASRLWHPFLHQPVADGQTLETKLTWQGDPEPTAYGGLMVRAGLSNRKAVYAYITRTPNGVFFHGRRASWGGKRPDTLQMETPDPKAPVWLRLARYDGVVAAFASLDGQKWTTIGAMRLGSPGTTLTGGVFATSGILETQNSALFENLRLVPSGEMPESVKNLPEIKAAPK